MLDIPHIEEYKKVYDIRGVNWRTISNYELGIREPSLDIIEKLSKYFKVSAGYLLGLED